MLRIHARHPLVGQKLGMSATKRNAGGGHRPVAMAFLKWLGWLVLSIVAAAGLSNIDEVAGFFGFVSVWIFRNRLPIKESGFVYTSLGFTLFGVGLAMADLFGHGNDPFWKGFSACFGLMGAIGVFPLIQNCRDLKEKLDREIYYSKFEWYQKQRAEKAEKELLT